MSDQPKKIPPPILAKYRRKEPPQPISDEQIRELRPFSTNGHGLTPSARAAAAFARPPAPRAAPEYRPFIPNAKNDPQLAEVERRKDIYAAFAEEKLSFDDLEPYRLKLAWRLVRDLAIYQNRIRDDEAIEFAQDWCFPRPGFVSFKSKPRHEFLAKASRWGNPLPLLPPSIPEKWLIPSTGDPLNSAIHPDYDPHDPYKDPILTDYCAILSKIYDILRLGNGSKLDPDYGRFGCAGLLDPTFVRFVMPSQDEIIRYEQYIIQQVIKKLTKGTYEAAYRWIEDNLALPSEDTVGLLKIAKNWTRRWYLSADVEDERGVMLARLEETRNRARKAFNIREELNAMKLIAQLHGLTKVEPENANTDFINVIAKVSSEATAPKEVEARVVPQLPLSDTGS